MLLTSSKPMQLASDRANDRPLVILDSNIEHLPLLIADLPAATDIFLLDPMQDGIEQITEALQARRSVANLHLLAHGSSGSLRIGSTELNLETLDRYASQLQSWSERLQGRDLLIYGCQVAKGALGYLFLQQLQQLTGANVAASERSVGRLDQHSNWALEIQLGPVQTPVIFSKQLQATYPGRFDPVVDFSVSTDTLIESEGTPFSFNFTLSEPPPAEGTVVRLEGSIPQAINQWNLFALDVNGLAGLPEDVSPSLDFSAFEVTIVEQNASIDIPIFNDFIDDSPQEITWTVTAVSGGTMGDDTATVTIYDDPSEVPAENTVPVASNDSYSTDFETVLTVNASNGVLSNDSDADGDALTAELVSGPSNGTVTVNNAGALTYTPDPGFSGTDSFTYQANDGTDDSAPATVTIEVGEAPVVIPEVSLTSDITTLVEDEGTEVTFTLSLSEPPTSGPVIVTVDLGKPFGLGDFDVFPPPPQASATGGQLVGSTNDSSGSGFTFAITEQVATFTLPIFDDSDRVPDGTVTNPDDEFRNDDQGEEQTTFTLLPGDGYTVAASADSVTLTLIDTNFVNTAPAADNDSYSTDFETALTVNAANGVLDGDTDVDGDTLTAAIATDPGNGTITLNANGSFTYTPDVGFSGDDSFTYTVSDGNGGTDIATVTVTVADAPPPPNTPPEADDDSYSTDFEAALTVNAANGVLDGDTDVDGDTLTAAIATGPSNGTVTLNANGSFTYTPDVGFSDVDSFTYTVSDGNGGTDTGTVTIAVNEPGDPVVSFSTTPGIVSEADGTSLVMNFSVDGDIPEEGITVSLAGDAPLILQEFTAAQTRFDTNLELFYFLESGVRDNVTGGVLEQFALDDDPSSSGFLSDFTFTITESTASITLPVLDDFIEETDTEFTYTLLDGDGYDVNPAASSSTFTVTDGVNTVGPTVGVTADTTTLFEDEQTRIELTFTVDGDLPPEGVVVVLDGALPRAIAEFDVTASNPRDPEDVITVDGPIVSGGNIVGTNEIASALLFRITEPTATLSVEVFEDDDVEGLESFTYTLVDGEGYEVDAAASSVDITIDDVAPPPTNTDPEADDDNYSTDFETELTVNATNGVLDGDTDADGDTLTAAIATGPSSGTVTLNDDGSFTYTPDAGFSGDDSFTYTVSDGNGGTDTATVTVTVGDAPPPPNTAPVADDDSYSTGFETALTVDAASGVLDGDTDVDGDTLTAAIATDPSSGTVTLNDDGSFTYTPDAGFSGDDSFTYTVSDGNGGTDTATVNVVVEESVTEPLVVSFTATPDSLNEENVVPFVFNFTVEGEFPEEGIIIRTDENFFPNSQLNFNVFITDGLEFVDFEEVSPGRFIVDWQLTQPNASLTTEVFDDTLAEPDTTFTTGLLEIPDANYTINPNASSVTVSVTDGVPSTGGPVVGLEVDKTEVDEGEPLTITITADGDIPTTGLEVFIDSDVIGAVGDFITTDEVGNPLVTTTGITSLIPNEDASGFIATLDSSVATISFDVFSDGPGEGPETFTFNVLDGEIYDVNAGADEVTITIDDTDDGLTPDIVGTDEGEVLVGSEIDNFIQALGGADTVAGGLGVDIIEGGNGDDVLRGDLNERDPQDEVTGGDDIIFGGEGNDRIGGKAGNDILSGDEGDDQIWGDDGDDILMGVTGNDILVGDNGSDGSGSDIFVFGNGDGTDTIVDFEVGIDFIGLVEGELTFADLTLIQDGNDTLLGVASSGETLAVLNDVQASALDESSFVVVPDVSNIDEALAL
ncbi:MAG: Ig-like domain-containing protein [Cyanobacteria bacterium P01_F01_bin.86]